MSLKAKDFFARELAKNDNEINLARAALLISEHLNQLSDLSAYYLTLLDDMAQALRPAVIAAKTDEEVIETFNRYLFEELQFQVLSLNCLDGLLIKLPTLWYKS